MRVSGADGVGERRRIRQRMNGEPCFHSAVSTPNYSQNARQHDQLHSHAMSN